MGKCVTLGPVQVGTVGNMKIFATHPGFPVSVYKTVSPITSLKRFPLSRLFNFYVLSTKVHYIEVSL